MIWWLICFGAIVMVIFGKWYFADAISRMRRTLSRQQREALEMKGALQDARHTHQDILRQIKIQEIDIARMKKRMAEQHLELHGKPKAKNDNKKGSPK
jgi:hypothetical protein